MAHCDLPGEAWPLIQPLLSVETASPRTGRPWADHRKSSMACSGCSVLVHHDAIYLSDMVHGRPFTTALTVVTIGSDSHPFSAYGLILFTTAVKMGKLPDLFLKTQCSGGGNITMNIDFVLSQPGPQGIVMTANF